MGRNAFPTNADLKLKDEPFKSVRDGDTVFDLRIGGIMAGKQSLALLLFFISAPAAAKPVFLDCTMNFKDEPSRQWAVMFDQEQGTFVWNANERYGKMNPMFAGNNVLVESTSLRSKEQFEIDRVTLVAMDSITIGSAPPIISMGTCKFVQPMQRQL